LDVQDFHNLPFVVEGANHTSIKFFAPDAMTYLS